MTSHNIIAWAWDNPFYDCVILVGLALGVFYGADGWRGSLADLDFKDTPRAKNLIWLLTGALSAIFGDPRLIDPYAEKKYVLADYVAGVLLGAFLTVFSWGCIVLVDNLLNRKFDRNYGTLDALGDYFYHGYRRYRERKQESVAASHREVTQTYIQQLTYSIAAAVTGSKMTQEQRLVTARNLLRAIVVLVETYRGGKKMGTIRANLMLQRTCDDSLRKRLTFCADRDTVESCLELVTCDTEDMFQHQPLVLPVPARPEDATLPGAPTALLKTNTEIVDDTRKISFDPRISPEIEASVRSYFSSKEAGLQSFASLRILVAGRPIGVVNVDCSVIGVFGQDSNDKETLPAFLLPFCSVFGILYSDL